MLETTLEKDSRLWLVLLCVGAYLLVFLAPVDTSFSDPWGTLLTSQALIETGSIRLDPYVEDERYLYDPIEPYSNGHSYNLFPLGAPLLALPAVWLAQLRGENMLYLEDNRALQNTLSSLSVVLCTLLVFALCRRLLEFPQAFAVTVVFVFGSSLVSTLGTALWSSNPALVASLAAVLVLLVCDQRGSIDFKTEALLGLLVFIAYLCRPTMALLTPLCIVFCVIRWRRIPLGLIASVGVCLGCFVAFSWREYGLLLPPYYQPSRLGSSHFGAALFGNLFSPSRGIFVFSPYLLLTVVGVVVWRRQIFAQGLAILCVVWIGLHWLTISSFSHWWGGWSFGNRLFADALPAAFLLTLLVMRAARESVGLRSRRLMSVAFGILGVFSIFVHSHQGLYNPYTQIWSRGVDANESRIFDWRFPQFLASAKMLGSHERDHKLLEMSPYSLGEQILPSSGTVVFEGFSPAEGDGEWRWSNDVRARVLFKVESTLPRNQDLVLNVEAGTYSQQNIALRLNGTRLGVIHSETHWEPSTYGFVVPAAALESAREPLPGTLIYELDFEMPGAVSVGESIEQRRLALCLRGFSLENVGAD